MRRKGVLLFKSGMTNLIYEQFLADLELQVDESFESKGFVFVDPYNNEMRYITHFVEDEEGNLCAQSISSEGNLEFLEQE